MQAHESTHPVGPRLTTTVERAVLALAVVLMLGGGVLMLADVVSAAIAIPLIAVGVALVAIEQLDSRRGR